MVRLKRFCKSKMILPHGTSSGLIEDHIIQNRIKCDTKEGNWKCTVKVETLFNLGIHEKESNGTISKWFLNEISTQIQFADNTQTLVDCVLTDFLAQSTSTVYWDVPEDNTAVI
ncbi:MAG: hypothetical protein WBG42_04845 [Cryomorphaceae bacterium]